MELSPKNETRRLRLQFLLPLLIVILLIVSALIADNYFRRHQDIQTGVIRLQTTATAMYENGIEQDAKALRTVMEVLQHDKVLHDALARKDRQALLQHAAPMFQDMKRQYNITHFYFTGTDRVNLLRVHQPQRYGDVINRNTTLLAERSGTVAYGVELGPLGTFTLRLVMPWYDDATHNLQGYVELGMEIDGVLENMRRLFGVEVFVLIKKEFLERKGWEDGMRTLGRAPDWDRFPSLVLSVQAAKGVPTELAALFTQGTFKNGESIEVAFNDRPHHALFLPLTDAAGRKVAEIVLLVDVSQEVSTARHAVVLGSALSVAAGTTLFALFYWLVGRIGRRIERDEQVLHQLAIHDGLTGLYNHRTFDQMLEEEIARAKRYPHPLSLLLLDIDHFKRVNDTYGHVAGDRVLEGLSDLLKKSCRPQDCVCRYGGEEIAIILPETDSHSATILAERLRALIEEAVFRDEKGNNIPVTVSIGVAALPEHAATKQELVNATDGALYAAKEGGRNRVCLHQIAADSNAAQATVRTGTA